MDTLWITSASLSLTTSSRASCTSTPLAKSPSPRSETAPCPACLQLCITPLSLSVRVSISLPIPWPPARVCLSPPAPTLCCAAMSREWFGLLFWGTALPCVHGEGGGAGQGAMCSTCSQHVPGKWPPQSIFPACSEQGLPVLHHLTQPKLNKSGWGFFLLSNFSVSPLVLSAQRPTKLWLAADSCNTTSSVPYGRGTSSGQPRDNPANKTLLLPLKITERAFLKGSRGLGEHCC